MAERATSGHQNETTGKLGKIAGDQIGVPVEYFDKERVFAHPCD